MMIKTYYKISPIPACKGFKYSMLFQNKLSSKAGQHIVVDFGRSFPLPLPQAAVATITLMACPEYLIESVVVSPWAMPLLNLPACQVFIFIFHSCWAFTFVEFGFSLYCLFISYLCRYRLHICRLLMALTILIKVCGVVSLFIYLLSLFLCKIM